MKLGYATPLESLETLARVCDVAAHAGFDFLEFPLAPLGLLEGRSAEAKSVLRALSLPCLVAQSFVPKGLPLTGPEAVGYAAEVNHDSLRVVIDFYHLEEEQTPLAEIGTYGDWIIHVQVADSGRRHPGTGSYDYPELARQLASIGYDDTLSVEVMHHLSDLEIAASADFLRTSWPADN